MKAEVKLYRNLQSYEAPYMELVEVATEHGFARSSNIEDVGKDYEIEF